MAKFSLFKLPLVIFCFHGNLVAHDVVASLIYYCFIYTLFYIYINLKDICVYVMQGNARVLDEELNLLLLGFLGMVFHMVLSFHINLNNCKCCLQHIYAIFFINFSNTLRVSMCSGQIVKKITIYFFYELLILMTCLTSVALTATTI